MSLLKFQHFFLVGIKGVAMTSLAQVLVGADKNVTGSDVAENFVTQPLLDKLNLTLQVGFQNPLPAETDCVIYTAAHQAAQNPQVKAAQEKNIPTLSQAEAVAQLFNQKIGLAVCGVGGKSTVSAMLAWILEKLNHQPSFSVGVGNIPGLDKTGQWHPQSDYFVIEADEYVVNPLAVQTGQEKPKPRFSFLKPDLTICTNLKYDHPDVYRNFDQTQQAFNNFFAQSQTLIIRDQDLDQVTAQPEKILTFGTTQAADLSLTSFSSHQGKTQSRFSYQGQSHDLELSIPGHYNVMNALAAILATTQIGLEPIQAAQALSGFRSTQRRFEFIGQKNGVKYYDDYAHHPHEVSAVIKTLEEWYPTQRRVIAFEPHTYSRTKQLFTEFVNAFAQAQEVILLDIFSSAREKKDPTVSSQKLAQAIEKAHHMPTHYLGNRDELAKFCQTELKSGDVLLTVGAGNIYQVHNLIPNHA